MARVPQAQDIGVSSFNVGNAAQIDIGVAKEIGRAGNAIGDAVAALGGAFGELAGRVQATEQAGAYSGLVNDLYDADAKIESEAYKNAAPDGSQWQGAGTKLGEYSSEWKNDPRWSSLTPKQKASAENAHRDLMRRRALGTDSYPNRYRKGQFDYQSSKLGETANSSLTRLSLDDPRNTDIAPQVFDERVEAEKALIMGRIDEMTGTVYTPQQAEELKKQYESQFVQRKMEFIMRDPKAQQEFFNEYNKLQKEEGPKPSYLGGPGSKSDVGTGQALTPGQVERLKGVRPELTEKLGQLQQSFGKELPINSGFRDKGHNAKVGGAKGSQHIHGNAVDLDVKGLSKEERVELIRQASAQGFTGIGVYNNAIHLDMGERRSWGPTHSSDSVPGWAKGVIGEHLSGKAQPTKVASAEGQAPQQGSMDIGAPKNADPKAIESVVSVASGIGVNPRAISEVFHMESGWRTNQRTGSYMGISQVGPKTLAEMGVSKQEYLNMSQAEQAAFYGKWLEHYKFPEKMQAAGIDLASLPPARQAAILQAFQFAPNGKWVERLANGDTSTPVTNAKQARALGSTSIADMEAYFTKRIGDQPAPPVQERGLTQYAGIERPEGMMTLGAGDVADAAQAADAAGLDVGRFANLPPETKLSEAGLTEEELTALEARAPEGVNVREVTVADAAEFIGAGQPATMNDAGPQEQVQAQDVNDSMNAAIKGGQEMIVRSGNGFMKFGPDELKYFTPKMVKEMEKTFKARQAIATKQNQALADEMMKAQISSLEKEGKDLDPKLFNPKVIDAAYPPGSKKRVAHEVRVAAYQAVAGVFAGAADKSLDEIDYEVEGMKPDQSKAGSAEGYNIQVEAYDKAVAKRDALIKQRDEDPAQSVESHSLVKEVRAQFENGRPKSPSQKQALIEARLFAQRQIGIPERKRSPITQGEAKRYISTLKDVPEEELDTRLEEVAKSVKDNYGPSYSGVVMKSIIQNYVKLGSNKEEAMNIVQGMASGTKPVLGPLDIAQARERAEMRNREALFKVPEELKRLGPPMSAFDEKIKEAEGYSVTGAAKWAGQKLLDAGRAANRMYEGTIKPPKEEIAKLRNGNISLDEFKKQYNLTPIEAFNYKNGKVR